MKNPIGCIKNVVQILNIENNKDKALKNLIDNNHAPIDIAAASEIGFVVKATKIFTKWSE